MEEGVDCGGESPPGRTCCCLGPIPAVVPAAGERHATLIIEQKWLHKQAGCSGMDPLFPLIYWEWQLLSRLSQLKQKLRQTSDSHRFFVFFRTLPVDAPPHWAPEAQRAGPDRGGLVSGPQLRLDPLPRPSQPGELQQRAGLLSEQTGQRAVCQRAGASTQRCTDTRNTLEGHGEHANAAAVNKRSWNRVSSKNE